MENLKEKTLKSIVLDHHEYIPVLEKYSLDFCCRGGKTLNEASIEKNIPIDTLLEELAHSIKKSGTIMPFTEMSAEQLISYILIHHHFYVRNNIPILKNHLNKIVTKHGSTYPNMIEVAYLFNEIANDLLLHMEKEEQILFPSIRSIFSSSAADKAAEFVNGNLDGTIHLMESEHEKAGDILYTIRNLTNEYTPPVTACTTHRICLEELKAFEADLHQHVHLENNILFPMIQK